MLGRAEPEIETIIAELTLLHRAHAAALEDRLNDLGASGQGDASLRGTMNTVAVTVRDWISGLGEGSLEAVERGEKALQGIYEDALHNFSKAADPQTAALLDEQCQEIGAQIEMLANR